MVYLKKYLPMWGEKYDIYQWDGGVTLCVIVYKW